MIAGMDSRAYNAAYDLQARIVLVRMYLADLAKKFGAHPELERDVKAAATAHIENGDTFWRAASKGAEDLGRACKAARWWGIGG